MSEYIERETLLKHTIALNNPHELGENVVPVSDIEAAPAADVAPVVHGRWKLLDECSNAGVYCSICHKAVYRESAWYKNVHIKSKYCPNCGAKMDKEDGET